MGLEEIKQFLNSTLGTSGFKALDNSTLTRTTVLYGEDGTKVQRRVVPTVFSSDQINQEVAI